MKSTHKHLIAQVRKSKSGQKRITLPRKDTNFEHGDYVQIIKLAVGDTK